MMVVMDFSRVFTIITPGARGEVKTIMHNVQNVFMGWSKMSKILI